MLAFLAITAVINIALGYALAVYLGKAQARPATMAASAASPRSLPTRRLAGQGNPAEAPATAPPAAIAPSQPETSALVAEAPAVNDAESPAALGAPGVAASPSAAEETGLVASASEADAIDDEHDNPLTLPAPAPVEMDLLAGIEEFRSQLAQLKGDAPAANAEAARSVGAATV